MRDVSSIISTDILRQSVVKQQDFESETSDEMDLTMEIVKRPDFFNRKVLNKKELSELLKDKLKHCQNHPFFCGRIGMSESYVVGQYLEKCLGYRERIGDVWRKCFMESSGFFSSRQDDFDLDQYAEMTLDAIPHCDLFLCWYPRYLDVLANYFAPNATLAVWRLIDYDEDWVSWVSGLEGKKVLVVSSFAQSIRYQYSRRHLINRHLGNLLPEFELSTYQMIQTQAGNQEGFSVWFDAYKHVKEEILAMSFDIAIIGAGAYGFPLAAEIRKSGRSVIEACSYTPVIFGIAGNRHIDDGTLERCGTPYWIRPLEQKPKYAHRIENACYW